MLSRVKTSEGEKKTEDTTVVLVGQCNSNSRQTHRQTDIHTYKAQNNDYTSQ